MDDLELTGATRLYPADAVVSALGRISSQALWLLFSLDHYGWRAEYDAIRVLLDARPGGEDSHFEEHSVLMSLGHLFALTDKLWRLVYGVRAHRAGREFLNVDDGYLTSGYKFHRKLDELAKITRDEWREILGVPSDNMIREHLLAMSASADDVETRLGFAAELPDLVAKNMGEIRQFVGEEETIAGPRESTHSLRALDGQYRHGAPVVYHACSPTDSGWVAVDVRTAEDHRDDTVGVVMLPPDESGSALISLVKHDDEMKTGLRKTSATLAALVHRLVRAQLLYLAPGLVEDPLAAIADHDV